MLLEKLNQSYSYSSLQINYPLSFSDEVIKWSKNNIEKQTLYLEENDDSFGIEDEIHTTVLFGITEKFPNATKLALKNIKPFKIKLSYISKFYSGDYDVLKINIISKELENLHYLLEDSVENENEYPVYQQHLTLAYVLKNTNNHLIGINQFSNREFLVNSLFFSSNSRLDYKLRLNK